MDERFLKDLAAKCAAYVDGYRVGGKLSDMMELKREHTERVVENARAIAAGEGFAPRVALVCEAAALLHDVGRYEQLKRYGTFRDADSVDHAAFSRGVVESRGWLAECDAAERAAVLDAVAFHNRRDVPPALDALTLAAAQTVRDADKLDIFRVLEDRVRNTDWRRDATAFWNLPTAAAPNPAVVDAVLASRPVAYAEIKSLADFVLIQVGWLASGLAYATSRRLAGERGHLAFRRDFLRELSAGPLADAACDFAAARMA